MNMEARRLRVVSSIGTLSMLSVSFEAGYLIGFELTSQASLAGQRVAGILLSLPAWGQAYVSPHLTFTWLVETELRVSYLRDDFSPPEPFLQSVKLVPITKGVIYTSLPLDQICVPLGWSSLGVHIWEQNLGLLKKITLVSYMSPKTLLLTGFASEIGFS